MIDEAPIKTTVEELHKLINVDNVEYNSGVNASINNATQVTNVATMIIQTGILISSGINLRNNEITTFDNNNTKKNANVIPTAFITLSVIANAGHRPSIDTNNGFEVNTPSLKIAFKDTLFSFFPLLQAPPQLGSARQFPDP